MYLICERNKLNSAVNNAQKAVSERSTLPILEGILLKTDNNTLTLTGNNTELAIKCRIESDVKEQGSVVVSSKIFSDIVKRLPDNHVYIEYKKDHNNIVTLRSGNSKFDILGVDPTDFPDIPKIISDNFITINAKKFNNMIKKTIFAVAQDETKPVFTGELLSIENNEIRLVALDGFRLAIRNDKIDRSYETNKVIIPGKNLSEISKILSDIDDDVTIIFDDKSVQINTEEVTIVSRLLSGNFINYEKIIPAEYKTRVIVDTREFQDSIERASVILRDEKSNTVKLNISNNRIEITSSSEHGSVYEEMAANVEGLDIEIGFNSKYLIEILRAIDDESICMEFTNNVGPCIIKPIDGNSYIYFILPVKLAR